MSLPNSIAIVATYTLRPNRRAEWRTTWQHLSTVARAMPECLSFRMDTECDEPNQPRVVSTWSSGAAFDRFVRETGVLWIERALRYSATPPHYARFALPERTIPRSAVIPLAHVAGMEHSHSGQRQTAMISGR